MSDNIIHLPRPGDQRPPIEERGLYIRITRNDHHNMMDLIASGETGFFGLVFDAVYNFRHRELRTEAVRSGFDTILDLKTQPLAMPGGHTKTLAGLPWASDQIDRLHDFDGDIGRARAEEMSKFAADNNYSQVLGPTHLLDGANDPWLRRDIRMMGNVRHFLDQCESNIQLIYPLAIPMEIMRNPAQRQAIILALKDAPFDAVWLKVDNFGSDATGEKTINYIQACRDFHSLGVPVIADHVGGLPGLGLIAFETVSGIAHGVTLFEGFKSYRWRKPANNDQARTPQTRIYVPRLDLHMDKRTAESFLNSSTRVRGRYGCRDTQCCPKGIKDMLARPTQHYIRQRVREINEICSVPQDVRVSHYLDANVRRVSDDVTAASGLANLDSVLAKRLKEKQRTMGRFRQSIASFASSQQPDSVAVPPERRVAREDK